MRRSKDERKAELFSMLVSICRIKNRPVSIGDVTSWIEITEKTLRNYLIELEQDGKVSRVKIDTGGRKRDTWFPNNRDLPGFAATGTCFVCGKPRAITLYGRELCRVCMRGYEDGGVWVVTGSSEKSEREFSLSIASSRRSSE